MNDRWLSISNAAAKLHFKPDGARKQLTERILRNWIREYEKYALTGKAVTFCPVTPALNSMGALLKYLMRQLTGFNPEG